MSKVMDKIRTMLEDEVKEKLKELPFGYGKEEGCEGFSRWCVYVDKDGKLHGRESLQHSFQDNLSVLDNIMNMPLDQIILLVENGLSGDTLFKAINDDYSISNGMCYQAKEDAKTWKTTNVKKMKP